MHIEKNFTENIFYMFFDILGKTKDNTKARENLTLYCNRVKQHLTPDRRKPNASYALTSLVEKRKIVRWPKEEANFFDGYASNWS
jgi:hypothetical protein